MVVTEKRGESLEIALILAREVGMMALLMVFGVYARKKEMLTPEVAGKLAEILVSVIMPIMLLNIFQRDKNPALMPGFWMMLVLIVIMFAVSALVATLAFRQKDASIDHKIARLAVALPNCGFMGIPLLLATTGEDSLLYCAAVIGSFQLLLWCWAIPMIDGKKPSLKKILINPGMLSFVAGLTMFMLEIRLPVIVLSFMNQMSSLNTPLSMLMTGAFLADIKLGGAFRAPVVYKAVFMRNLVIPAASIFLLHALGVTRHFGENFSLSFVILIACSSAASTLLVPLRAGKGGDLCASQMIAASSLFSIVTMPFMAFVAEKVL